MEHSSVDPSLAMPMHLESGGTSSEIPPATQTVEQRTFGRVTDSHSGSVALSGSETLVVPIVSIADLPAYFREHAVAFRQAS